MIIQPKVRGFLCSTAHPEGCAKSVSDQIHYVKSLNTHLEDTNKILIIGSSTGYGLSSRIAGAYLYNAATIGVMYERPATDKRTATAGWYNTAAFEKFASADGIYAKSINGDAFSNEIKEATIDLIKKDWGKVDMVIYSLAAPKRTMPDGTVYSSSLKTIKDIFTNKSLDLRTNLITEASISPATEEEIIATQKVMGGEDWFDWISALQKADVLSENAVTLAYSYIGPTLTYPVYFNGTIGGAKKHLHETASRINEAFKDTGIHAVVSINKALVTQSSSAIPIVPLYITILYKLMKEQGTHENCIMQISRLFTKKCNGNTFITDENGLIRMDDYEMDEALQSKIIDLWNQVTSHNLLENADIEGYWEDFYHMFGFHYNTIDYDQECNSEVDVLSLKIPQVM